MDLHGEHACVGESCQNSEKNEAQVSGSAFANTSCFRAFFVRSHWRPSHKDSFIKTDWENVPDDHYDQVAFAAGIERGRGLPCLRAARASQSSFSQINPIMKNRFVQIWPGVRSTSSLAPINKIPRRRSTVESPNCPAGPFMHFTASTKFRIQRNTKNDVPKKPISSKNSRIPL